MRPDSPRTTAPTTPRRSAAALAALVTACGLLAAACSTTAPKTAAAPATGSVIPTTTIYATTTASTPPLSTPKQINTATAKVMDKASSQLILKDEQKACVAARVEQDPILLRDLGDDPATSKRWGDLTKIGSECITTVTFSAEFANGLQTQAGGTLNTAQLACARQASAAWTGEDIRKLTIAALNPAATDPAATERITQLLRDCAIDPTKLAPTGPSIPAR